MRPLTLSTIGLMLLFCAQPVLAEAMTHDPMDRFKQYMNRMVTEVHKTDDPAEKRELIEEALLDMEQATERLKQMRGVDAESVEALSAFKAHITDKLDQLNGDNGYERVADVNLDRFADYVQQDLEQAQRLIISIGAGTLALILLLLLLV